MNWLKRIIKDKDSLPILILIFFGVLAGRFLLAPGYFNMHDDLQIMRQLEMEKCFADGQIPCRWVPDMGYGYGFPLFNYYPPLPYLIGQGIRVLGFSFVSTVKLTFLLSFVFSGLAMYLLTREFWGRLGGMLSAVFYVWAPYHALDVFVRGAMNEAWSFVFFPLILWSSYRMIRQAQFRYIAILALSWAALFMSHNLMALIFSPLFAAWVLLWLWRERSWFTVPQLAISGLWGFGLAAFFTLPVFLERSLVQVETLVVGYYEYIAHFADLNQLLLSRFWGYGPSVWETADEMAFQVGHLHWLASLAVLGLATWRYQKGKKIGEPLLVILFFFAAGWFATFMAHLRSIPIWQTLEPFLKFVQFPWRFVTLSTFSFSFLVGGIFSLLPKRTRWLNFLVASVLVVSVLLLNKDYFRPERMGPLTDQEKFSGAAWELQQTAGIYDYLPKAAQTAPKGPREHLAEILEGNGEISAENQGTNWARFRAKIGSDTAKVRINIFQFPDWRVFVDDQEVELDLDNDELGRMHILLSEGEHEVSARLFDTPARTAGNLISLASWLALFTAPIWRRR